MDYKYPSALNEDKQRFYEWFQDKPFKAEFDTILDALPNFNTLDRCLIHTDLGPHNSVRNKQGEVILIDLDDAVLWTVCSGLALEDIEVWNRTKRNLMVQRK